jgi:NADP-dependent 3-hydroxy acid dehydrogenase YdfG
VIDLSDAHTAVTGLAGKRVLVTGGTTGIGRAIAVLLASEGARLFICGRDPRHLEDALKRIRDVGDGDGIATDLADPDNVAIPADALSEMSEKDLRYAIATDFTAYLLTAHAAVERLEGQGDIVLIGSMSAHVLGPHSTVYAGIKYGIQGFAEAFRREMGPKGVKISLVEPGKTGSDMQLPDIPPGQQREMIRKEESLRAEDIAVGVHYILTQPNRAVVQQLTIAPRVQAQE